MSLDLIKHPSHCTYKASKLLLCDLSRDEHRDNARQDLVSHIFWTKDLTNILIDFEELHTGLRISFLSSHLLKSLQNISFQSLSIYCLQDGFKRLKNLYLQLLALSRVKYLQYSRNDLRFDDLILKLLEDGLNLG